METPENERPEGKTPPTKGGLAEWLLKIPEETAPLWKDGRTSTELLDELYDDETGLPKFRSEFPIADCWCNSAKERE